MGSGVAIKASIVKYGVEVFAKELIAYADTPDNLNTLENKLILQERAAGKAEYNLHIGSPVPHRSGTYDHLTLEERTAVYEVIAAQNKDHNRRKYQKRIEPYREVIIPLYNQYKSCKKVADHLDLSVKHVNRFIKEHGISLNYQTIEGRILDEDQKKRISDGVKHSTIRFQFICQFCQSPFESKSNKAKRCSDCFLPPATTTRNYVGQSQNETSHPVMITSTCTQCDNSFEYIHTGRVRKFCSKSCSTDANRKPLPPIEVIERLYWDEKLSANEIGRRFGLSGQTIRNYMRSNDVARREERHHS